MKKWALASANVSQVSMCIILQVVVDISLPPLMYLFQAQHLCVHYLTHLGLGTTNNGTNVVI
jgi:hypothetical protein